jgi:hypothetical protein
LSNLRKEKLRKKYELAEAAYEAKTRPIADMEYLKGIHELQVRKKREADAIWLDFESRLSPILDEFGVAGPMRIPYRVFARRLLSYFLQYPKQVWQSYIEALKEYYAISQRLSTEWLDRIANFVIEFATEVKEREVVTKDVGQEA